jgi:hypothetical protein
MPGFVLNVASTVLCMHGGTAILTTANTQLNVDNLPALLESDVHSVAGCPFQIPFGVGTKPSPCILIRWAGGSTQLSANGGGVLVQSSIGTCYSPEGVPQGIATIAATQTKVSAA